MMSSKLAINSWSMAWFIVMVLVLLSGLALAAPPNDFGNWNRSQTTKSGTKYFDEYGSIIGNSRNTKSGTTWFKGGQSYGRTFGTQGGNQNFYRYK